MEIIDKHPSRWTRCLICAGGVHTNYGCGSRVAVEVSDLFYVLDYQKRKPERMAAFQCPLCGLGTVVAREGSKDWTTWFDNLHKRNPLLEDDPHGAEALKALHLAFTSFVEVAQGQGGKKEMSSETPLASTASPVYERVHTALHVLWSKSVGSQDYVKREWAELETAICALAQEADRRLLAARGGETPTGKKTA